ncbi:hypothetical protein [Vibrio fluvialis]|uniref:hypothetical protein n=1 Tax=Vibrio fluvialis TaxID=676 RepID=UPI001EEBCF95|nr:hypothetical protein [Vibrio fluvialis]MCG6391786.1 hypothetical protein [Vibrio fluvialis]
MKCTARKAQVIETRDRGPSVNGYSDDEGWPCFATMPDCEEIRLEGVNCTTEEFIEWFLIVEQSLDRYDFIGMAGEDNSLLDIGGSSIDCTVGAMLEITFDAYFDALLTVRINDANRVLEHQLMLAKRHLGLIKEQFNKSA